MNTAALETGASEVHGLQLLQSYWEFECEISGSSFLLTPTGHSLPLGLAFEGTRMEDPEVISDKQLLMEEAFRV